MKPWDTAAGAPLVTEAGGSMRRLDGAPWSPRLGDVVAAAPGLTPELPDLCAAFTRELGWQARAFGS